MHLCNMTKCQATIWAVVPMGRARERQNTKIALWHNVASPILYNMCIAIPYASTKWAEHVTVFSLFFTKTSSLRMLIGLL